MNLFMALCLDNLCVQKKFNPQFKLNVMKKFVLAAALLLAITGIGFAQTAPAAKPAAKPETAKTTGSAKHQKSHASKKKAAPEKTAAEKKN